ncbi:hypothetical protein JWS13_04500 (plasmid) [Rhodococcus pseudokoreensis]|uniref:Rap1a immunity protein domain-containing protein n=1 Tax=Rhodococcus pseudokoreensis TaxID=2811421 RepID=A0A974ZRZ7_9NOCA|nr:hypothetical protein [Rhodococcus pseudokoreensis]QSE87882.1 hypothetical protein JWS13_04500 [Rhodococcus pseudokoreensis]
MAPSVTVISFTPNPGRAPLPDAAAVADYLQQGSIIVRAVGFAEDCIDPTAGAVVPIGCATDGEYSWPLAIAYYVRRYGIPFDGRLLESIRERNYQCPSVPPESVQQIRHETWASPSADPPSGTPFSEQDDDPFL